MGMAYVGWRSAGEGGLQGSWVWVANMRGSSVLQLRLFGSNLSLCQQPDALPLCACITCSTLLRRLPPAWLGFSHARLPACQTCLATYLS